MTVRAFNDERANVIVAGLSGTGTFGSAALICRQPTWFELPRKAEYVRAFLVEVYVEKRESLRCPVAARVLARWTQQDDRFEDLDKSEFTWQFPNVDLGDG